MEILESQASFSKSCIFPSPKYVHLPASLGSLCPITELYRFSEGKDLPVWFALNPQGLANYGFLRKDNLTEFQEETPCESALLLRAWMDFEDIPISPVLTSSLGWVPQGQR